MCCGISINTGVDLIIDCFCKIFCIELIGWNADDNEDDIVCCCSFDLSCESSFRFLWPLSVASLADNWDEKRAERDRLGSTGAIMAVGRVKIPSGGIAVNTAGGVDCSLLSNGCWASKAS